MLATAIAVLRQAARRLRLAPGYSLTVLTVLALGIGATTAIFSVVYGVLLKPYEFEGRGQLVVLRESVREFAAIGPRLPVNYRHFVNLEQHAPVLQSAAILQPESVSVGVPGTHPDILSGLNTSPGFLQTLGIAPLLGRDFLPEEFTEGRDAVAILSRASWERFFPSQTFATGRVLRVDGKTLTIVGILPGTFRFPAVSIMAGMQDAGAKPYGILTPHVPSKTDREENEEDYDYFAIGRLRPGISVQAAQAQLNGLEHAAAVADHLSNHPSVIVEPFSEEITGGVSRSLVLLLLAVGGVLGIGCINLANLQLARSVGLMPEHALRSALGASRGRMVLESLTENLLLAAMGVLLALPLAQAGLRLFLRVAPSTLPRLAEVRLNLPVFAAALGLALVTSLFCGLLPAWRAGSVEPVRAMQSGSRGAGEPRSSRRLRSGLLITEMACSVVLLAVTGLLTQSFSHLMSQARALGDEPVTMAQADLLTPQYQGPAQPPLPPYAPVLARAAFIDNAIQRLRALPGVVDVGTTDVLPLTGEMSVDGLVRPDHPVPHGQVPLANLRIVSPNYFAALGISVLAGRAFTQSDREHGFVMIISESAAKAAFPGENPLGHTLDHGDGHYTVIGIAADARVNDPRHDTTVMYLPFWWQPPFTPVFLIRGRSPAASEIKQALWSVDPQVAIPTILPLAQQTAESVAVERFQALLVGAFGAAGLLLAMLGVYGAVSYSVNRRMREWGLRMALGSGRGQLQRTVLGEAARPLVAALLLGSLGSLAAERWVRSLLYGGDGHGWAAVLAAFGPALLALPICVLAAAWPAARRAAHADPATVLRME